MTMIVDRSGIIRRLSDKVGRIRQQHTLQHDDDSQMTNSSRSQDSSSCFRKPYAIAAQVRPKHQRKCPPQRKWGYHPHTRGYGLLSVPGVCGVWEGVGGDRNSTLVKHVGREEVDLHCRNELSHNSPVMRHGLMTRPTL